MRDYVHQQTAELLRRFAAEVNRTAKSDDPECIHDLRVSIRRLSGCLRAFSRFYPEGAAKRLRCELAELRDLAGTVRDRHIALDLLAQCGIGGQAPIVTRLEADGRAAGDRLLQEVCRWKTRDFSRKWSRKLGLR